MSEVSAPVPVPPQFVFDRTPRGLGTMRSTGDTVSLFLSLEIPQDRAQILVGCALDLGISLAELTAAYQEA